MKLTLNFSLLLLGVGSSFSSFAGKPIKIIVIAGDEIAIGTPLKHFSEVNRTDVDAHVPFAFSYRSKKENKWVHSNSSATLAMPSGDSKTSHAGPELSLIRSLHLENPKQNWAVLKVAEESSDLLDDWLRGMSWDGQKNLFVKQEGLFRLSHFMRLLKECDRFILELKAKGYSPQISTLIWAHGRSLNSGYNSQLYSMGLHKLIDLFRDRYGLALPFVVLHPDGSKQEGRSIASASPEIKIQKAKAVQEDPLATLITTNKFPRRNSYELSTRGQLLLGHSIAQELLPMLNAVESKP